MTIEREDSALISSRPVGRYVSPVEKALALRLAQERQQLSHEGVFNPTWAELTADEQAGAVLDARNYLRAAYRAGLLADPVDLESIAGQVSV